MKYTKGQHVIYSGVEICTIGDTVKKDFDGEGYKEYIMLYPLDLNTTFYTPVEKSDELIRPLLSKEKLMELIKKMASFGDICKSSTENRNINFRNALKSGNYDAIISIMNDIYSEKLNREKSGKQLYRTDRRNFDLAKKLIDSEIAVAFEIEINQVEDFIKNMVNN